MDDVIETSKPEEEAEPQVAIPDEEEAAPEVTE